MPPLADPAPDRGGVPLADLRRLSSLGAEVGVLVICGRCQDRRLYALEAVIARLAARGLPAETIGIRRVTDHVRGACPACGAAGAFETRPHYPGIPGMNGFRADGA